MEGAWDGGCVRAARGTGSSVLFPGGGGRGHGTAVAGEAAPGGAGVAVAWAGGGGCVWAARGTGSAVLFVGGGGRGLGTVVARLEAPGGAGAAETGPWGVVVAPRGAGAARDSG